MVKLDPTVTAVAAAAIAAIVTSVTLNQITPRLGGEAQADSALAADALTRPVWAASATGRVEPKDGEVRISSEAPARIVEVIATTNDRVKAGDPLVILSDDDLEPKLSAALSEAEVRILERDEEPATGVALERRQAEDALNDAERARFRAQLAFDETYRQAKLGSGDDKTVAEARE